jgi:hypothetical protein
LNDEEEFRLDRSFRLTKMMSKTPEDATIEIRLANTRSVSPIDFPWVRHTKVDGDKFRKAEFIGEHIYLSVRALD